MAIFMASVVEVPSLFGGGNRDIERGKDHLEHGASAGRVARRQAST
jgi:hypothetical protein